MSSIIPHGVGRLDLVLGRGNSAPLSSLGRQSCRIHSKYGKKCRYSVQNQTPHCGLATNHLCLVPTLLHLSLFRGQAQRVFSVQQMKCCPAVEVLCRLSIIDVKCKTCLVAARPFAGFVTEKTTGFLLLRYAWSSSDALAFLFISCFVLTSPPFFSFSICSPFPSLLSRFPCLFIPSYFVILFSLRGSPHLKTCSRVSSSFVSGTIIVAQKVVRAVFSDARKWVISPPPFLHVFHAHSPFSLFFSRCSFPIPTLGVDTPKYQHCCLFHPVSGPDSLYSAHTMSTQTSNCYKVSYL